MSDEQNERVGRGRAQQFAVDKLGVQEDVLRMYKEGLSAAKISAALAAKGVTIAPFGINRWLTRQRQETSKSVQTVNTQSMELMVMDYKNEITTILEEVKAMKQKAIEQNKLDTYVKLVGKLYDGMELLAKLMGDIKPSGSVDINIVINEINQRTFEERKSLRNELYGTGDSAIIDVEAEIVEDDKEEANKINLVQEKKSGETQ